MFEQEHYQPAPTSEETRHVIHAIRNDQQKMSMQIEMQNLRIQQLEQMTKDHIIACAENKAQMKELFELLTAIKQGMRLTNFLRNAFVWLAGLAGAAYTLYHTFIQK